MTSTLVDLFLDAVRIDAVSLREAPVVRFLRDRLAGLPVTITEDRTASKINGDAGNILCVPHAFDPRRPALALLAHMDTPRPTTHVKPVVGADRITSDGTTVLGVDNRAGFSVLLYALAEHLRMGTPGNIIVVFTVAEELGMYGAKHVDLTPYNIKHCFVFDCSKRPGTFIQSAVGSSLYFADFIGKTSHAGVAPEKGINAIKIAANALSKIPVGRLSPTMTSNVGLIHGGEATNVVPDRVSIQGEVREFDARRIDEHLDMLRATFTAAAAELGGRVEFRSEVDFPPFVLPADSDIFHLTVDVLTSVDLTPAPIEYLGGSDANMLNARGPFAVNLGIGAQNPHGNDEFILLQDLEASLAIARELIKRSTQL